MAVFRNQPKNAKKVPDGTPAYELRLRDTAVSLPAAYVTSYLPIPYPFRAFIDVSTVLRDYPSSNLVHFRLDACNVRCW